MPHKSFLWGVLACLLLPAAAGADESLYVRFGGRESVQAIVDIYVEQLSTDVRTKRAFEKSDLKRIKRVLHEQLCALMGGPCTYEGDSMRDVHAGHRIDDREFLSGVAMMREVLIARGIGIKERNEFLALLAPMKRDVVDR